MKSRPLTFSPSFHPKLFRDVILPLTFLLLVTCPISARPTSVQDDATSPKATPHELLQSGKPAEALAIMKQDASWINRPNRFKQTPLYFAAQHNHVEAARWLLENGADVDAQAYNRSTPLHVTANPELIKLFLQKSPDLSIYAGPDNDPFQNAVDRYFSAESELEKNQWRELLSLFRDSGADYDLETAIRLDDLKRVKEIFKASPELIDSKNAKWNDRIEFHLRNAISTGALEISRFLIETGDVDVNDVDSYHPTSLLFDAVAQPEIVRMLIDKGADPRVFNKQNRQPRMTALHHSAMLGAPESTRLIMDHGGDAFELTGDLAGEFSKKSALEIAAIVGNAGHAMAMLEHASFKQAPESQRTKLLNKAVFHAIDTTYWRWPQMQGDRPRLLQTLVDAGADVDRDDAVQILISQIQPPYSLRLHDSQLDLQNTALRSMAAILTRDGAETDLATAVALGDENRVKDLLALESQRPNSDNNHPSSLGVAVTMNHVGIVKRLIDAGTDVNARATSTGRTPLHVAASYSRVEMAQTLLDAGAKINATSDTMQTPLHCAQRFSYRDTDKNLQLVRLLLENGADPDAKDANGKTPLQTMLPADAKTVNGVKKLFKEFQKHDD